MPTPTRSALICRFRRSASCTKWLQRVHFAERQRRSARSPCGRGGALAREDAVLPVSSCVLSPAPFAAFGQRGARISVALAMAGVDAADVVLVGDGDGESSPLPVERRYEVSRGRGAEDAEWMEKHPEGLSPRPASACSGDTCGRSCETDDSDEPLCRYDGVKATPRLINWDVAEVDKGTGLDIWLHVYDLGPVTSSLNNIVLKRTSLGAFHCGVEVFGHELSFQGFNDSWDDPTRSGVVRTAPRMHPAYSYRESVCLGRAALTVEEARVVLDGLAGAWPASSYHLVSRNCATFAEELCRALSVPEPFPVWVRGASDAARSPAVHGVADFGWEVFKWFCRRPGTETAGRAESEGLHGCEADSPP